MQLSKVLETYLFEYSVGFTSEIRLGFYIIHFYVIRHLFEIKSEPSNLIFVSQIVRTVIDRTAYAEMF